MTIPTEPIGSIPRPSRLLDAMAAHAAGSLSAADLASRQDEAVYLQLASEADPDRVLAIIAKQLRPGVRVFVGVTDPISADLETPQQVRDRVLRAADHIPPDQLGTCDDCGFAPFADDTTTSRELAFAKIGARVAGTALAAQEIGI